MTKTQTDDRRMSFNRPISTALTHSETVPNGMLLHPEKPDTQQTSGNVSPCSRTTTGRGAFVPRSAQSTPGNSDWDMTNLVGEDQDQDQDQEEVEMKMKVCNESLMDEEKMKSDISAVASPIPKEEFITTTNDNDSSLRVIDRSNRNLFLRNSLEFKTSERLLNQTKDEMTQDIHLKRAATVDANGDLNTSHSRSSDIQPHNDRRLSAYEIESSSSTGDDKNDDTTESGWIDGDSSFTAMDTSEFDLKRVITNRPLRQLSLPRVNTTPDECVIHIWICQDKFGVRYEQKYSLYLTSIKNILDLKKNVIAQAELEFRDNLPPNSNVELEMLRFDRNAYLRAWVHLKGSSVLFSDKHPSYMLAFYHTFETPQYARILSTLAESEGATTVNRKQHTKNVFRSLSTTAEESVTRSIDVYMELYKQECPYPEKVGILKKQGGGLWKMIQRKRFTLRRGRLTYTKDGKDPGRQKEIPLISFEVRDIKNIGRETEFEIVTANRCYHFQALSMKDKLSWLKELNLLLLCSVDNSHENSSIPSTESVKDKAEFCASCKHKFMFWTTKFHCVQCNLIFDENCFNKEKNICLNCVPSGGISDLTPLAKVRTMMRGDRSNAITDQIIPPTIEEEREANVVGDEQGHGKMNTLMITVNQAFNLMPSDQNGLSDPYVVIYFEGLEYRTETVMESLDPRWDEDFVIPVKGKDDVIWVGVYDADKYLKDDFLGLVCIPLSNLQSGVVYCDWFQLHGRPGHKYAADMKNVRGEIQLQICYTYSNKTFFEPVGEHMNALGIVENPAEDFLYPPLSTGEISHIVDRIQKLIDLLQLGDTSDTLDVLFSWKHPPRTLFFYMLYVYIVLYFPSHFLPALIPGILVFFLFTNYIKYRFFVRGIQQDGHAHLPYVIEQRLADQSKPSPSGSVLRRSDTEDDFLDSDEEEEEFIAGGGTLGSLTHAAGVRDKPLSWLKKQKEKIRKLTIKQNKLGYYVQMGERFSSLMVWTHPIQSRFLFAALLMLTVVLLVVPFRYVLLIGGTLRFFSIVITRSRLIMSDLYVDEVDRKLARKSNKSSNPVRNFIQRAPLPWDVACSNRNMPKALKRAS